MVLGIQILHVSCQIICGGIGGEGLPESFWNCSACAPFVSVVGAFCAWVWIRQYGNMGCGIEANLLRDTGLLYNLYGDAELGTNLVKQEIYDMQSAFYPTVEETYGVPLDTRHNYTKSKSSFAV